jgi:hypothetical protein
MQFVFVTRGRRLQIQTPVAGAQFEGRYLST